MNKINRLIIFILITLGVNNPIHSQDIFTKKKKEILENYQKDGYQFEFNNDKLLSFSFTSENNAKELFNEDIRLLNNLNIPFKQTENKLLYTSPKGFTSIKLETENNVLKYIRTRYPVSEQYLCSLFGEEIEYEEEEDLDTPIIAGVDIINYIDNKFSLKLNQNINNLHLNGYQYVYDENDYYGFFSISHIKSNNPSWDLTTGYKTDKNGNVHTMIYREKEDHVGFWNFTQYLMEFGFNEIKHEGEEIIYQLINNKTKYRIQIEGGSGDMWIRYSKSNRL